MSAHVYAPSCRGASMCEANADSQKVPSGYDVHEDVKLTKWNSELQLIQSYTLPARPLINFTLTLCLIYFLCVVMAVETLH